DQGVRGSEAPAAADAALRRRAQVYGPGVRRASLEPLRDARVTETPVPSIDTRAVSDRDRAARGTSASPCPRIYCRDWFCRNWFESATIDALAARRRCRMSGRRR